MVKLGVLLSAVGILLLVCSTRATVLPEEHKSDFPDKEDLQILTEAFRKRHEDADLSVVELIDKYGYNPETHTVATNDKYVLEMHRITGPKSNPSPEGKPSVLLMHGLLSSSTDWIITGPRKALGLETTRFYNYKLAFLNFEGYILADAGYDVWMGNVRGTFYSRKHLNSSVKEKSYWSFSWHEIGTRDLPTMIDYILEQTGHEKIFYIGHSQGTTAFFVMASELPEYNNKIISMHALAPVAFCKNMISPPIRFLSLISDQLEALANLIGMYEFRPTKLFNNKFASKMCDENSALQPICENVMYIFCGFNPSQTNLTLLPTILAHVPAGASINQFVHYAQLIKSDSFHKFDYGLIGNLKNYGRFFPPDYDLSKITARVFLHYSDNDYMADVSDVERLYNQLRNPVGKIRVPNKSFNHLDYIWAIDANILVHEKVVSLMSRYRHEAIN